MNVVRYYDVNLARSFKGFFVIPLTNVDAIASIFSETRDLSHREEEKEEEEKKGRGREKD